MEDERVKVGDRVVGCSVPNALPFGVRGRVLAEYRESGRPEMLVVAWSDGGFKRDVCVERDSVRGPVSHGQLLYEEHQAAHADADTDTSLEAARRLTDAKDAYEEWAL